MVSIDLMRAVYEYFEMQDKLWFIFYLRDKIIFMKKNQYFYGDSNFLHIDLFITLNRHIIAFYCIY